MCAMGNMLLDVLNCRSLVFLTLSLSIGLSPAPPMGKLAFM